MTALILDTSSDLYQIGLLAENRLLDHLISPHNNSLSAAILPCVENILFQNNVRLKDLDFLAVGIGPGSYTGTRVGVAIAKGLSFALQKPLLSFYSPLAYIPSQVRGDFLLALEAKSGLFFTLRGQINPVTGLLTTDPHQFLSLEELKKQCQNTSYLLTLAHNPVLTSLDRTSPNLLLKPSLAHLPQYLLPIFQEKPHFSSLELHSLDLVYFHNP